MDLQFVGNPEPILQRLCGTELDDPVAFGVKREAEALAVRQEFERLRSLEDGRVRLYPHQERAVWRVLRELRGRAILADEVGLGKTIEAGVLLKEYALRGLVSRALILVPPGLLTNWRAELERLGIPVLTDGLPSSHRARGTWLLSLPWARTAERRDALSSSTWDLLIVDEAHRLRHAHTQSWRLVDALRTRYLLLLTATPVQND